ncbi:hypothetical protein [Glutamicibacter sp. NPDC087344]|uniref:hypothetical protein n=1 Tax=Glutamicibacter sp. NPDC087344 TaxID=3363994 RepID=UPI00382C9E45
MTLVNDIHRLTSENIEKSASTINNGSDQTTQKPKKPMSYKYSTGLPLTKFMELQNRIQQILDSRPNPHKGPGGRPRVLNLHQQLRIMLHLLCHNVRQAFIADQYDIRQKHSKGLSVRHQGKLPLSSFFSG